jgi:hypothetical protein
MVAEAVAIHGPSQLERPAIVLNWRVRQLRTRGDALASSFDMPEEIVASPTVAGSKT